MKHEKNKLGFQFLIFVEWVYLSLSIIVVILSKFSFPDTVDFVIGNWVQFSYFFLPVLLFKNVAMAIANKNVLMKLQRQLMMLRCSIYVLLIVYSYPLIWGV